ncbi:FecR family protein [Pseudomonas oryzihabitans]|uniref:Transmembrane sensor n=1 Tax=Pseudomonas oryzihabitans TaxID=47885 RepID=A0AAJ2EUK1_9PSED|nr:FecR domain-containing protein [Pseudomonas psychrotolerans]MDR6232858.1 transmembrane sensor [Pseudomonas psychrotolerans]MDR6358197.1 transmembrane sensor [Pseudomonas psychrotolerans]
MSRHEAAILAKAADWLVRLEDAPEYHQAFTAWCAQDPRHQAAVDSLQQTLQRLEPLAAMPARAALNAVQRLAPEHSGRGRALTALVLTLGLLLPTTLWLQANPPAYLMADLRTGTAEWRETRLADGSRLLLDAQSAVDLEFDAQQRRLRLIQGDILVDVAHDSERPFIVETPYANIHALGTRFVVEQGDSATWVTMLESRTEIRSTATGARIILAAGQRLRLDAQGPGSPQHLDVTPLEQAWQRRQLVVWDRPLPEVLATLARSQPGYLSYDAQTLADFKVSAVLPQDDPKAALTLLARSFPLDVRHYGPWLTRVTLAQKK